MKKVLITGKNSYIGTSLENWLSRYQDNYSVDSLSLRDKSWMERDFSNYDVVFHVAAIVHNKENPDMEKLYFKINRDLTIEVAKKAKKAQVKQFIFMSTMAVYGKEGKICEDVIINKDTKPNPKTFYGKSKLEAEYELKKISDENFKVLILRPPIIYGKNCPGNYSKLEKVAKNTIVFPLIDNQRSMLNIDKLTKLVQLYIDNGAKGICCPQDDEYVNTSFLVRNLGKQNGKKIYLSPLLGKIIYILGKRSNLINKVFGNLVYQREESFFIKEDKL